MMPSMTSTPAVAPPLLLLLLLLAAATAPTGRAYICDVEHDVDYLGSDINDGKKNIKGSWQECCSQCEATAGCVSWTYLKDPSVIGVGRIVGECYLKNKFRAGWRRNECCTSGSPLHEIPTHAATCVSETDVDYLGSDIIEGSKNIQHSPEACCYQCLQTEGCVSWTYVKDPSTLSPGRTVGECHLKNKFRAGWRKHGCCISGYWEGFY